MKKVIVMAVISLMCYQASAQQEQVNNLEKNDATVAILKTDVATSVKADETGTVTSATPAKTNITKTKKPASSSLKAKKPSGAKMTTDSEVTLTNESSHKARSRFDVILQKRLEIDSKGN
jgi:hypothetical protein